MGDLNLFSDTDDAQPQDFLITDRYAHPAYKPPLQYNDIALVRLDKEAVITPYVRPLCLQVDKQLPSYSPIATGWGTLQYGGETSDYLMKVTLKYFSWEECQAVYRNLSSRKLPNGIEDDTQVCAGGRNEEKDTCQVIGKITAKIAIVKVLCFYLIVGRFWRSSAGIYGKILFGWNYFFWKGLWNS